MRANPARYPFLLQSVTSDPRLARFDILFACPGETLELNSRELAGPGAENAAGFLDALDAWWRAEQPAPQEEPQSLYPFTGGWFLYLGYELAAEVEPSLRLSFPEGVPVAFATRVPVAVINDRLNHETLVISEPQAARQAAAVAADLDDLPGAPAGKPAGDPGRQIHEEPADDFIAAVNSAKEYIRQGDIFQANLSRRWQAELNAPVSCIDLYERLCATNPAPFAGLIMRDDCAVISSSPERLIRRRAARIDTRPIAGTRPRAEQPDQINEIRQELLAHPKERAEHIMLIDLERNDLGRVCVGGSVHVDEYMVVESYSHVHHIVSNVTGEVRPDVTPGQLIRAVFPGGTITGCPKVRCMEIIQELEGRPRGAYTGSMGYLNLNGDCDLNILIRTMTLRHDKVEIAAGSGIVADSDPQAELDETRAKAKGMILALGELQD
jgi:anthranilate synthase component 1